MASDPHDRAVVYTACVQAAADLGALAARHLLKRAGDAILQRAAATTRQDERKWLVEAAQLLSQHQQAFRHAFSEALRREFAVLEAEDSPQRKAVDFESLELMGEEQIEETVELLRAQQMVLSQVESELAQLNALISAAKGRQTVSASANPFPPDAWVRALRHATQQCSVPGRARARWLQHLSEALGPELCAIYAQLCDLLRKQGVTAAAFALNAAQETRRRTALPSAPAPASLERPRNDTAEPSVLNLRDLRRLLVGDGGAGSQPAAARSGAPAPEARPTQGYAGETFMGGVTVPFAFEALQEMKQMDEALQRMKQRRSDGAIPAHGAAGAQASMSPAQVLSQEVVKLMVDNIARDERLLPQVRQAMRDLEPALLRLARNDPRFFRDKHHPTREFLTEVTERSLAWPSAGTPGFAAFFEPLRQAVEALAALPMDTAEPFEFALRSLDEAWSEQEQRSRRERANAARTLVKAEKRNLIAQRISDSLRQRPDVTAAPPEVRRFLTGPWAQVMAAAEMAEETEVTPDPGGYFGMINDLIWTTQPRLAAENRIRLARLVPPMLTTLRRGLASIEYPADATQRFLDFLADLHQVALRPQPSGPVPLEATARDSLLDDEPESPQVWLEPSEARESGLMAFFPETGPREQFEMARQQDTDRAPIGGVPVPPPATERLHPGVWADLYLDNAWSRWRLAWASPHSMLFMFTDGDGRYKSMTRSVVDTMIAVRAFRFVSEENVLTSALDAVAERALHNSMASVR